MAPVFLNPPHDSLPFQRAVQIDDYQYLQLLSSSYQASSASSLSCPTFLSSTQAQRMIHLAESQQFDPQQLAAHGGSSDLQPSNQVKMNNISNNKLPIRKREVGEGSNNNRSDDGSSSSSAKWMPSKMRLMHKMINNSSNNITATDDNNESAKVIQKLQFYQLQDNIEVNSFNNSNSNNSIRACSDCNTTTTPLWRSGPRGPKSLCNACGIRKRKARKAMEAAAAAAGNGTIAATDSGFTKIKLHIKEKKPRTSQVMGQYKKQCKTPESDHHHHEYERKRKLCFKDFALSLSNNSALKQVFPQDVEEAATLLMELSCGLSHA